MVFSLLICMMGLKFFGGGMIFIALMISLFKENYLLISIMFLELAMLGVVLSLVSQSKLFSIVFFLLFFSFAVMEACLGLGCLIHASRFLGKEILND